MRQKSKATWIVSGDTNTEYFHTQWSTRISRNSITLIYDANRDKITDPVQVKATFRNFFIGLIGTVAEELPLLNSKDI